MIPMVVPVSLGARLLELDARIRAIDPAWEGAAGARAHEPGRAGPSMAGPTGAATNAAATSGPSRGAFARELMAASHVRAGDGPTARFRMPLDGSRVSQPFGPTESRFSPPATVDGVTHAHFHDGLDLAAPLRRPVTAAADGTVRFAGRTGDGAIVVVIDHGDGVETQYGHLAPELDVAAGNRVRAGDRLGAVGLTGRTTGPHLHFELRRDGDPLDPAPWLEAGRLPGDPLTKALEAGPRAAVAGSKSAALTRFDAVADRIPHAGLIRDAAVAADVDPLLLASLVRAESGFRPDAVSSAGAMGLTQLMPATARSLGVADPFDARQNLDAGTRYLANNLRIYGRVDLALAAYQAGKGAVARAGGIPDSPTTHRYIDRILGSWAGYLDPAQGRTTP